MFLLTIIEVVCLCVFTAYLVNEYAQREVPLYVKILTFISWIMSFGIVFLLPHDIYYVALYIHIDSPATHSGGHVRV